MVTLASPAPANIFVTVGIDVERRIVGANGRGQTGNSATRGESVEEVDAGGVDRAFVTNHRPLRMVVFLLGVLLWAFVFPVRPRGLVRGSWRAATFRRTGVVREI